MSMISNSREMWLRGTEFPIQSLSDVLELLQCLREEVARSGTTRRDFTWHLSDNIFPHGIWFRGESDYPEPLTPSVFRSYAGGNLDEAFVMNHLQTRIQELYRITNPFQKLCVAAHYGIPTRLLDWTESLLVACYFAVAAGSSETVDGLGKLYVLNARTLNDISGTGQGKEFLHAADSWGTLFRSELAFAHNAQLWGMQAAGSYPAFNWQWVDDVEINRIIPGWRDFDATKRVQKVAEGLPIPYFVGPIAVIPQRDRERMIVQSSEFVLFGGASWPSCKADYRWQPIPRLHPDGRPVYLTFTIGPVNTKIKMRTELEHLGVHEGTLFPEMERQRATLVRMGTRHT